jgi:Zn-finger nucleic acid-binding protein
MIRDARMTTRESLMKCPVCNDVDLTMSERQGVEIDYCPRCRGVWLDRGELDKIIARSDRDEDDDDHRRGDDDRYRNQPPPPHQGGYGKPYKKKSFWHELFD